MNNTTMLTSRIIVPVMLLFSFSMSLPAQTDVDPALEEAFQDAEFMQFLKRTGQSLDVLQKINKSNSTENNTVSNNTKTSNITALEIQNRLLISGMLENLQHCTTPGFKKRQTEFGNRIDMTPGEHSPSRRELDLAIEGDGFFRVCSNDNAQTDEPQYFYTRYGSLERDTNGNLAVIYGTNIYPLEPKVAIPEDWETLQINPQGQILPLPNTSGDFSDEKTDAKRIILVRFSNPTRLHPENAVLFSETPLSGKPMTGGIRIGKIRQHTLEQSNVSPKAAREEMERLIDVSKILKQL